ncbi:MAG: polyprenyl synthetase family protein [Candidatus Dadabacteria bacterium]|nr:polyprenyl synthetase family protein [Candidatus Dadabacteria bacterium]
MEFSDIIEIIHPSLAETERKIDEFIKSDVPLVYEIARYLLGGGGKRIRPSLVLLSSAACGLTDGEDRIAAAAGIELFHAGTLFHDDVVDQAEFRRGNPSSNMVWGNKPTVLVGDFMLARGLELIYSCGSIELLRVVSRASSRLAEGHVLEIMSERKMLEISEEFCFSVIDHKTAALIKCSTETGALLADTSNGAVKALSSYGRNIGIAFQLIDDALDYCSEEDKFGKKTGQDLAERKMTLPLYYSIEKAPREVRNRVLETLDKEDDLDSSEIEEISQVVSHYRGVELTRLRAKEFAYEAKKSLDGIARSDYRESLDSLADYVAERNF